MNSRFWYRLRVYLFGVLLGLGVVYFLLIKNRNRDFTNWMPEKRVKTMLAEMPLSKSRATNCLLRCATPSADFKAFLRTAEVDLARSAPRENPKRYLLKTADGTEMSLLVFTDSVMISSISKAKGDTCPC